MLKSVFTFLDSHPPLYWLAPALVAVLLVCWVLVGLRPEPAVPRRRIISGCATALILLACLLAWRWPYLLSAVEYNPDESQFIAGAITLAHDPVFWRAVDGTTSGPLNFYALLPIHWLGLPLDYFSARLTGLLLVWLALIISYGCLRDRYGRATARLGVLPAVAFFSLVHEWDFIHFSSEHVPLLLLAAAAWCFSRSAMNAPRSRWLALAGGAIAGLLPWTKLQATPLAALMIGWGCWRALRQSRPGTTPQRMATVAPLLAVAALPTVIALAVILAAGQWDVFVHGYLLQNFYYVSADRSLWSSLVALLHAADETYLFPLFAGVELAIVVWAIAVRVRRREAPDAFLVLALLLAVVAAGCVTAPRRGFLHYVLLAVVPLILCGGAAFAGLWRSRDSGRARGWMAAALLLVSVVIPGLLRTSQGAPDMLGQFSDHWRRPRTAVGNILHRFSQPGDQLTVWGWMPRLYVESALPQATRIGYSYLSIMPSPLRDYHRALFLQELQERQPAFFVDAVGPNSYYFVDRATQAHESVPGLREYIEAHYVLLADLGYARTYFRRDHFDSRPLPIDDLPGLIARGRPMDDIETLPVQSLALTNLPERTVAGHLVRMMLPPAEATWLLDGTEREFIFEYGYDPVAWRDGQGNGTEFFVYLESPGTTPQVLFKRLLNPARVAADRLPQTAQIDLPLLPIGARLRVSTSPGEFNDNSWDWAYISRVRYRRGTIYTEKQPHGTDTSTRHAAAQDGTPHQSSADLRHLR